MFTDKPVCVLSNQDGNVFNVIGLVAQALRKAGQSDKAKKFTAEAMKSGSYDDVLALCFDYVDVE